MAEKTKFVVANSINYLVTVNEVLLTNARKRVQSEITVPNLFDRAYMMFHESGIIPVVDTLADEEVS